MTSDIAIRVENYILSAVEGYILSADLWSGAEGLGKLYPAVAPRARHIGRAQQRHDTPSTRLRAASPWDRTRLRDAISDFRLQIGDLTRPNQKSQIANRKSEDLWALKDVSFESLS
jgi:hypothetical protein